MEKLVFDIEIRTQLDKAVEELEKTAEATKQISDNTEEIRKQGKTTNSAISGLAKGFKGLGLAMKSAGIGLAIAAFEMLRNIIMQNQPIVDALEKGTTALGIVFNRVADVVADFGGAVFKAFSEPKQFIDDTIAKFEEFKAYIVDKFSGVGDIIVGIFTGNFDLIKDGFEGLKTGVVEVFEDVVEVVEEVTVEVLKTADALVEQRKAVELLEAGQQKLMLQYQTQAELQRQIRDDESITFEQRIAANEELGRILDEQLAKEKDLAQQKLDLAQLELAQNKDNLELQKAVIAAETELVDIEERITGQRSEQLTNTNALIREQKDAINELREVGLTDRQLELEEIRLDYEAKLELARKAGVDTVAITEQYNQEVTDANKRFAENDLRVQKELDDKKKKQQRDNLNQLHSTINMAGSLFKEGTVAQKGLAVASAVMDTYKAANAALAAGAGTPIGWIQAAAAVALGLKNVKEILKVDPTGGATTSPSAAPTGGAASFNDTQGQLSQQVAQTFNLQESLEAFGQTPIQAYVVQQDVQEQTEIQEQINQRATL